MGKCSKNCKENFYGGNLLSGCFKKFGSKVQLNYLASGDISYYIVYKISDKTIF